MYKIYIYRVCVLAMAFTLSYTHTRIFRLTIIQLTWQKIYILYCYCTHTHARTYAHYTARASNSSSRRIVCARGPAAAPIPYRGNHGSGTRVMVAVVLGAVYKEIESLKTFARASFLTVKSSGSLTLTRDPAVIL